MTDTKKKTLKKVENTMACSAFAEAGEPCPIDVEAGAANTEKEMGKERKILESVEKDFACTAFHDQNMNCEITNDIK